MFRGIRIFPPSLRIDFIRWRVPAYVLSLFMVLGTVLAVPTIGLNFGIDFRGGILIEGRAPEPVDIGELRRTLGGLGLGEVQLQEFGRPTDVLINIQRQEGAEREQLAAVEKVKAALGSGLEYRRVEFVGPKVGDELIQASAFAVALSLLAILGYIWFRFEWHYGVCAIVALAHDVIATIGLFALIQHEFNLSTVAALLTIAGYSINDTVVIFDRIRENLRKYKKMPVYALCNLSINETLSRTVNTSLTTLLSLSAIYFFGGAVIADFALAMIWGVCVGTYSTLYVATGLLLKFDIRRAAGEGDAEQTAAASKG